MDSVGARVVTAAISGLVGKGASKEYAAAVRAAHDAARAAPGAPFGAEWFRSTIAAVAGPTVIVFYRGLW